MSLSFTASVTDTIGTYGAYTSLIQTDLSYAGSVWASYINSNASIEVQVNIAQTAGNTAEGAAVSSVHLSSIIGLDYWRLGTIAEMLTGVDPNGALPDVIISVDPDFINQWLYFDPNPSATSVVPANKVDAVDTFEHELGHAFGIGGFLDSSTGLPKKTDYSTFDAYVAVIGGVPYFTGPAAEAVYGGPVPLTIGNLYHVGNSMGLPGSDLLNDLMNGVQGPLGKSSGVSTLDLAILSDVGVPIKSNGIPTITSNGGSDAASVSIAENTTAVTTVTAIDPDVGQNLSYSISGGADANKFAIGASTGALSFVSAPNFEAPTDAGGNNVYDVTVKVSDGLGGIDTQAIAVSVQNVAEISRVERFFDSATRDHFYTLSPTEANQIWATLPTYHDEGAPWGTPDKGPDTIDVFRFFDVATGAHFLTTSAAERDHVIATLPSYHYEGVGFEAYAAPGDGTLTLERFFNTQSHLHHYAASPAEIASILSGGAGPGWVDEGAGFIVHV